jgi:ethanolamine utilization protein EutN
VFSKKGFVRGVKLLTLGTSFLKNQEKEKLVMIIGKVIDCVVSTRKNERLIGQKLLIVRPLETMEAKGELVAIDNVGAGIGEVVLVTTGSSARLALRNQFEPVDAVIVGIVD